MSISKKTIDNMLLSPEVKAELQKELIKVDQDSYLLTPKAIQILNELNGEIINAAQLGQLNLNDRIYMNGEHITAGKTVGQIIDEHMRQSLTKIVEDGPDFEKRKVIPPESEVTFYNESRIPLEKLTMKNEYKFESWEPSPKKYYAEIDSVPNGKALELLHEFYPALYNFAKHNKDLVELGAAFVKWIDDCKWVRESHFEQITNPHDFPSVAHMYSGDEFLTMREAFEQSYFVERSHPYFWRWSTKLNGAMFLDYRYANIDPEIKGVQLNHSQKQPKVMLVGPKSLIGNTDWAKVFEDAKLVPMEDLHAGMMDRPNSSGKTLFAVSTGMALNTSVSYEVSLRSFEEREPNQPTVRTNGRQKIIDNGKRQWPEAKRRKGHRKHG